MSLKKNIERLEDSLGLSGGGDWWKWRGKVGRWKGLDLRELPLEELRAYRDYIVNAIQPLSLN